MKKMCVLVFVLFCRSVCSILSQHLDCSQGGHLEVVILVKVILVKIVFRYVKIRTIYK